MTTMPTSVLDALTSRYRVERELGAGGMATVFLAEDVKPPTRGPQGPQARPRREG